jgi:putative membrane protein
MNKFAVALTCLLFASPAVAQSVGEKAQSLGEKTGVNAIAGIAPTTADFVTEAAIGDMFEIQSSKLAVDRSDAATKSFATKMIADHEKTSAELKATLASSNSDAVIPPALDKSHQKMLDELGALNGDDFTKKYHDDQVSAHKDAVSLFKRYAKGGDNAALKSWAGKTLPMLKHHLAMAKALDK